MTYDETATRAGEALRARFDGAIPPILADTPHPHRSRRPSNRRSALVGVAVVLTLSLAVAFVASRPGSRAAQTTGAGTWRRVDMRRAFGPHGSAEQIIATGRGFIAAGTVSDPTKFDISGATSTGAMWTSEDGEHWDRVPRSELAGARYGFSSLARYRGNLVAITRITSEVLRSTDGRHWRRTATLATAYSSSKTESLSSTYVAVGPHGFVAVWFDGLPTWTNPVFTSADGRQWAQSLMVGTESNPVGLIPGAPLEDRWLTLAPTSLFLPPAPGPEVWVSHGAPFLGVFVSRDALRWTRLSANPPERLALPLRSTHDRRTVLGIQYERQGSFGGRLWSTRDGAAWTEITSFHRAFPTANPDHLIQSGRWWVLAGNRGADGKRQADMWVSSDLRHWSEMPARLRGAPSSGGGVPLAARGGTVVGISAADKQTWIWRAPH